MSQIDPKLLTKLLNSLPVFASYVSLPDLRYEFTNDANRAFFNRGEIIGKTMHEIFGDNVSRLLPNVEKVKNGEHVRFNVEMPNENGINYLEATYVPDFGADGKVIGFFVHVIQTTNYRMIFDRNPMPMFIWALDNKKFLEVNFTMETLYGFTREEFLNMSVLDIRPPEDIDDFMERVSTLAPGYRKEASLVIHKKKDGTRMKVLVISYDIKYQGRDARIVLINDVTERLKVEEERETLLSALREALKARDEFLTMASHELKTPITSLVLNTDLKMLMVRNREPVEMNKELTALEIQRRQLNRINQIIDDMLDLSRIRIGKLEMRKTPVDFARIVEDSLTKMSPLLLDAGEVNYENAGNAVLLADPFRLEQVVTNLLSNAVKYGEKKPITVTVNKTDTHVSLSVEDQGRGISPADQKRIFTRFERAVSNTEISGLGLGLTIVKEIVEAHQGHITIQSTIGKGSVFTVEFPLLAD